ncbi:MAG: hypothetical protein LC777_18725 [Actinobacteria bacterium]|nr:hypothetical protein [Actinomycetota bacterium]
MGKHRSVEEGACVMELASMLGGEPFSDEPSSVCPVIRDFLRSYNDRVDDEGRQALYACAAAIVGSRSTPCVERERLRRCAEAADGVRWRWSAASTYPLFPRERHAAQRAGWVLATGIDADPGRAVALVMDLLDIGREQPRPDEIATLGHEALPDLIGQA